MCVPGCQQVVLERLGRRAFLGTAVAGAAAAALAPPARAAEQRSFSRAVDLTHPLGPDFPTFFGKPQLSMERLTEFGKDGYNMWRWIVDEHTGTHMDAPWHFSADGPTADMLPVENLVVALAVVDISARAADDPDAQLTPDDIEAWEAANGPLPEGCCVAMNSGWDGRVSGDGFRNADADGIMHFPGFHPEATAMLMEARSVNGIVVDTLSLDYGASKDFATHYAWLPSGRWGIECAANLGELPASGATLVVGGPRIVGASGGPTRLIALV